MQLIKQCDPKNVILVHGEKAKMEFLHDRIKREFQIPCYFPANGETVAIETSLSIPIDVSVDLLKRHMSAQKIPLPSTGDKIDITKIKPMDVISIQGVLTMEQDQIPRLTDVDEAIRNARMNLFEIDFNMHKAFDPNQMRDFDEFRNSGGSDIRIQALDYVYRSVKKTIEAEMP
ncbi:11320_t:CDS:1, partial [Acaulospora colombiana]